MLILPRRRLITGAAAMAAYGALERPARAALTTWNSALDPTNIAYSNGNLTCQSADNSGTWHYTYSTTSKSSGLLLVEVTLSLGLYAGITINTLDHTCGFEILPTTGATYGYGGGWGGTATLWGGLGSNGNTGVTVAFNWIAGMAYTWLSDSPGWRGAGGTPGANPSSGVGGFDISPLLSYSSTVELGAAFQIPTSGALTANFTGPFYSGTPSGYQAWDYTPPSGRPVLIDG